MKAALGAVLLAGCGGWGSSRFGARAKYDQHLADALDGLRRQCIADIADQAPAVAAIVSEDSDLNEFVALEGQIDLAQHGRRETGFADHDDRMQMMRTRPERAPLR